jgi:MinD-like ATPase involved in chromosome partitioning or flagellar assembly
MLGSVNRVKSGITELCAVKISNISKICGVQDNGSNVRCFHLSWLDKFINRNYLNLLQAQSNFRLFNWSQHSCGIMEINIKGIIIIVGNYGSGKTEVAINLAVYRKRAGIDVRMADLDLINPYFRTREAGKSLALLGIDVVIPPLKYFYADLPILSPNVAGLIRQPSTLTILDAGGNDAGAAVLAALGNSLKDKPLKMLQVVNPFRPFTETIEGCIKIKREIEKAAKMPVTGIIGNANLMDETTIEHINEGYEFVVRLSENTGLKLEFITASINFLPHLDQKRFSHPVLPIERQLVPPWKQAVKLVP